MKKKATKAVMTDEVAPSDEPVSGNTGYVDTSKPKTETAEEMRKTSNRAELTALILSLAAITLSILSMILLAVKLIAGKGV